MTPRLFDAIYAMEVDLYGADSPADDHLSLECADDAEARELAAAINGVYQRRRAARVARSVAGVEDELRQAGAL